MKPKIFKPSLLALAIVLAISTANFAQEAPAAPPAPPVPPVQLQLAPLQNLPPLKMQFQLKMKDM